MQTDTCSLHIDNLTLRTAHSLHAERCQWSLQTAQWLTAQYLSLIIADCKLTSHWIHTSLSISDCRLTARWHISLIIAHCSHTARWKLSLITTHCTLTSQGTHLTDHCTLHTECTHNTVTDHCKLQTACTQNTPHYYLHTANWLKTEHFTLSIAHYTLT